MPNKNTAMQDAIVREITVKAPQERVYHAITDPTQLIKWFPDAVEGTIEVGQQPVFTFEGHGKARVYIVGANPFDYFAFRWVPGGSELIDDVTCVPTTLIEFTIEDMGGMSKITLKESGFASLPAEVAEEKFSMNSGGWDYMMGRLEKLTNEA
jgi:uncharacterized protein YndB with AHSA1/START domain